MTDSTEKGSEAHLPDHVLMEHEVKRLTHLVATQQVEIQQLRMTLNTVIDAIKRQDYARAFLFVKDYLRGQVKEEDPE